MVDIEPYQYQKVTNIKEHNDIVAKINEIVDVINNSGADTLGPRIDKLETDVSAIDSAVKIQYQDIASIKDKDQAQDNNIGTLDAQVKGITESLISSVNIIDGTTTGKFKVRLDREKAPSINSNDYDLQKATSIELIQGSGPSMLKAQITLSDGTTLISDDFLFTTEAIGTDVYISSFVFKNGNVDGTISADIGLSNGSTLEANNFVVPMDPSLLNTVQDLSTRLTAVESGSVAGFKELEAQVNTNKTNITTLTTEIDDLDIRKADQSNSNQEIVAGTITATNITKGGVNVATVNDIPDISGKVNIAQGTNNAGKVLGIGNDGNVTPTDVGGGEEWEEVDLNNWPNNWVVGDRIRIFAYELTATLSAGSWTTKPTINTVSVNTNFTWPLIEFSVPNGSSNASICSITNGPAYIRIGRLELASVSNMNDGGSIAGMTALVFNGAGVVTKSINVSESNIGSYFYKVWRLKK